jgi:hypothetical protein
MNWQLISIILFEAYFLEEKEKSEDFTFILLSILCLLMTS